MRLVRPLIPMFALAAAWGQTYTINTVAGTGTDGFSGDGGPATSAQISPSGVAVDLSGNLYIADSGNNRVRRVAPGGTISTVAGIGTKGYSGDGGPATSAQLNGPTAVAVDNSGNVYVADWGNHCIRKLTPGGMISTVAGTGTAGYSGDGGPAISAQLNFPIGVAVDSSGNLYLADSMNFRIRKVAPGGTISTVAGTGIMGYSGDGAVATSAQLSLVTGVAVDAGGNLYLADSGNQRIRKVAGGAISTVAGNGTPGYSGDGGPATSAQLYQPWSVAADVSGNLYIADRANSRIRKVAAGGTITTIAGTQNAGYSGDGGPAINAKLNSPSSVALDANGRVFIAEPLNSRIRVLLPDFGASCSYAVSTSDLSVSAAGGKVTLTIHTDSGCGWNVSGLPGWVTVSESTSGTGSANITLVLAANVDGPRTASISAAGVSVPIRQTDSSACGGSASCVVRVLPHLACGTEWTTGLFAINSTTHAIPFAVAFYGDDGSNLALPFGSLGNLGVLGDNVPAQGTNYYEAANPALAVTGGWGLVTSDASVTLHGLFRRAVPGGDFYEAGVADSGGYSGFMIPFDATAFAPAKTVFYTGFAIANLNPSAMAHVSCTARDQAGVLIPNAIPIPALSPLGHWANYLFPSLAGKRGTLDCSADTLVSAIALRFIGTNAFSSLPVIVK